MSLFTTRTVPRQSERRDINGFPWVVGTTVPTPLQSAATGYAYTPVDGFQIAAVTACVGLRAGAFAQLPLKGYQDVNSEKAELVVPQPELLTNPSNVVVPSVWKTQMSISRDLWGYAVGRILAVDGAGYASKVDWLLPDLCKAKQEYVGGPLLWKFKNEPVDSALVFHVPSRWVTPGNPLGMSPLEKSGLVSLAKMAQDFGRDWFLRGAVPSAILRSDKELTTEQADDLLARMVARFRRRQPAVIGKGMEYEKISVPANESQFLETIRSAASDIAISFNLPPTKIAAAVSGQSVTYQNLEQSTQQYLMDSINPDLVVIQESIARHQRAPQYCRWSTGAFLRADLKTRYEAYQIGLEAGFLDKDEVRAWEDLAALPSEDVSHSKRWQEVWLTTLVDGGVMTKNEARVTLGLTPVPGGDEMTTKPAAGQPTTSTQRELAEMIQKIYLGVGVVVTDEEARALLNESGGNFPGALPITGGAA